MLDQLTIIKSQLNKLVNELANYEGTEEELSIIKEALPFINNANLYLAGAKTILSNYYDSARN